MEENDKVFSSTIQRSKFKYKNDLYELVNIEPAEALTILSTNNENDCEFIPRTEKYYIPKKRYKLKVKTVQDIRKSFEDDILTDLPTELERQKNTLFKKIRDGSSGNEKTVALAKKLLDSETPISRSAWQMLININPEQKQHPKQFVLWNKKCIQVNGSKGGGTKFITTHNKNSIKRKNIVNDKLSKKNKGLLQNSLSIKFKPGPLGKKKYLDDSHQKYHVGDIELIDLPKLGLDIQPILGTSLDPTITYFVNKLRNEDGIISQKWAELAASVVGAIKKSDINQMNKDFVTFELMYKYDQHRILMRRDIDSKNIPKSSNDWAEMQKHVKTCDLDIFPEIEDMMSNILDSVEISLMQDNMYTSEENNLDYTLGNIEPDLAITKDKLKRKYCELSRLDVTVIRVAGETRGTYTENCHKPFCSLGCICDSLRGTFNFKRHCGRLDCMFLCKCDVANCKKYHSADMDSDLIPGLLNLDSVINMKLAKEEQKFHQTVIVTDDKSIVLKSQKRNTKAPKKYADFYKNINSKQEQQVKSLLIISAKLDCTNIEPWCMVHNLYKCFCKGKFTQSRASTANEITEDQCVSDSTETNESEDKNKSTSQTIDTNVPSKKRCDSIDYDNCSRVIPYPGRKYDDSYYKITNDKILEMEKNDAKLHQRLMKIINKGVRYQDTNEIRNIPPKEQPCSIPDQNVTIKHITENNNARQIQDENKTQKCSNQLPPNEKSADIGQILTGINEVLKQPDENQDVVTRSKSRRLPNKTKLVEWLECNYKMYKERADRGITKIILEAPRAGKVALYPWDFILNRYRERKNIFLISRLKPFRIFMAVDSNNPIFENCMNINDIRFVDLPHYPVTIKNLLTNATDLKDNFCILCGLTVCWEVIGSVTKVSETSQADSSSDIEPPFNIDSTWEEKPALETSLDSSYSEESETERRDKRKFSEISEVQNTESLNIGTPNNLSPKPANRNIEGTVNVDETSKWFVMTVENDFSEIRFYKRGFFVKYENIIKAINVARISNKTVRLSSQKCVDKNNGPQFGIYAIPNANEYCVFIGPYDMDQSLGIETIKTILDVGQLKRTRGFWISTSKVDNLKVIDNPLSFMPELTPEIKDTVTLDNNVLSNSDTEDHEGKGERSRELEQVQASLTPTYEDKPKKIVKPIKIRKTNGFYHFASNGLIKKISNPGTKQLKSLIKPYTALNIDSSSKYTNIASMTPYKIDQESKQDIVDDLPKISSVYSTKQASSSAKKSEIGMFILKPEEINQKLFGDKLTLESNSKFQPNQASDVDLKKTVGGIEDELDKSTSCVNQRDIIMDMDVQNFLFGSMVLNTAKQDVCIISDEEDKADSEVDHKSVNRRQVWIDSLNAGAGPSQDKRNKTVPLKSGVTEAEQEIDTGDIQRTQHSRSPSREKSPTSEFPAIQISNIRTYRNNRNIQTKTHVSAQMAKPAGTSLLKADSPNSSADEEMPWNQSPTTSAQILDTLTNSPDHVKSKMAAKLGDIMSMAAGHLDLDNIIGFEVRYSVD